MPAPDLETIQEQKNQQYCLLLRLQQRITKKAHGLRIPWGPGIFPRTPGALNEPCGPSSHWHRLQRIIRLLDQCQLAIGQQDATRAQRFQYQFYHAIETWDTDLDLLCVLTPPGKPGLPPKEEWCKDVAEQEEEDMVDYLTEGLEPLIKEKAEGVDQEAVPEAMEETFEEAEEAAKEETEMTASPAVASSHITTHVVIAMVCLIYVI
jgi:hypothetical protein